SSAAELARDWQQQAQPITDQVTDQAKDMAKRAKSKFGRVMGKAQSKLNETQDRLRSVKDQVQDQLDQVKNRKTADQTRGDRREWLDVLPGQVADDMSDAPQTIDTTVRPVTPEPPASTDSSSQQPPSGDDDDFGDLGDWAKPDPWQDDAPSSP
ncbi:MAG: hypothetical protein AAGF75_12730, partial [Cyanobacteria bacterium P01_H01_bin.130]